MFFCTSSQLWINVKYIVYIHSPHFTGRNNGVIVMNDNTEIAISISDYNELIELIDPVEEEDDEEK